MALENENIGHGLSVFYDEQLWVRWIDVDGKKIPIPEIGAEYHRFADLPRRLCVLNNSGKEKGGFSLL